MYQGDDIDLLCILRRHGWSDVLLYVGGDIAPFRVSHVFSDPAAELVRLAIKLHERTESIEVLLCDEPGGYAFQFVQRANEQHIYDVRLCSFPEGPPAPASRTETVLTKFAVKADHFVKLIHGQLEKVLKLLEEKSYRKDRDFPYAEFKRLRQQLAG